MKYERAVATGQQKIFYTMQFINTKPYLFHLKTLLWQSSPFILLMAGGGFYLFLKGIKKYRTFWPLMLFSVSYFLYVGSWYAKFNRYLILIVPILILLNGVVLDQLKNRKLKKILVISIVIVHGLWALAFLQIYQKEHSRITASSWIENNIPEESIILHEERDERLPIIFQENKNYQYLILELYQNDNDEKIDNLSKQLSEGDYLIIASQRLYRTIPKSIEHPYTSNYYQLLFSEELGYRKIMEFNSYPELFGLNIKDDGAEETFKVFDHPRIFIFENVEHLEKESLYQKIMRN